MFPEDCRPVTECYGGHAPPSGEGRYPGGVGLRRSEIDGSAPTGASYGPRDNR